MCSFNYFIRPGYAVNLPNEFFDDTPFRDQWQKEVYLEAANLASERGLCTILDIGCGSGFKP